MSGEGRFRCRLSGTLGIGCHGRDMLGLAQIWGWSRGAPLQVEGNQLLRRTHAKCDLGRSVKSTNDTEGEGP
jgi:hypothetical protein